MPNPRNLSLRWPKQSIEDRFWSKVHKTPTCWLWTAHCYPSGYGHFQVAVKVWEYAHRMAWCLSKGSIPKRLHVLHSCDIRNCVNPAHLWLGTHAENMADMTKKGRRHKGPKKPC